MEKFENNFDKDIKSLLDAHQPDVTPQWEHMSEQLQSAYEDEIFDEKIRKVLNNAQVQHQQLNWDVLDQKIKMQAGRKRKIITARIIESTLFLLILWTLDNIGIGNMIQEHIQIQHQPLAFEEKINANSKYPLANITTNQTSFGLIPSGQIDPNSSSLKDDISSSNPISARAVPNKSSGISSPIDRNQFTSVSISGINEHEYSTKNISYSTPNGIYHYDKFMSLLTTFHRNNIIEFKIPGTLRTPEELELPIHADGVNLLVSSEPDFPELIKQIKPSQLNYSKSVGLFTGAMVNVIQSPSFIQPDVNYTQAQFAHQLGLKVDFHHGPWTLKTGIAYQHINYQPNFSETLGSFEGGYFKIHFKELEAHLVSVPVALSKSILSGDHWDLSAHMGLALTASLKNYYHLDTVTDLSVNNVQNINFNPTNTSEIIARVRNESNKGLLEGGNIGTNSYASLIAGLRYQRSINPSLSYFGELEFSKMLGQIGFGPNNDKFMIVGFNTGVSYRFGGN